MKFGRITANHQASESRVIDLFTTDAGDTSTQMKIPAGTANPLAWLNAMFAPAVDLWADEEQFQQLPERVLPGALFTGDRTNKAEVTDGAHYLNANGTDGNGNATHE